MTAEARRMKAFENGSKPKLKTSGKAKNIEVFN